LLLGQRLLLDIARDNPDFEIGVDRAGTHTARMKLARFGHSSIMMIVQPLSFIRLPVIKSAKANSQVDLSVVRIQSAQLLAEYS
jgi:hypothetical protein